MVQVLFEKEEQVQAIKSVHAGAGNSVEAKAMGSHFGVNKTVHKLVGIYYWKGMYKDMEEYIRWCHECQMVNLSTSLKGTEKLHPIPIPCRVWCQIGVDLMKMKPVNGFNYVMMVIDYFTKYVKMQALWTKTADEVAQFI